MSAGVGGRLVVLAVGRRHVHDAGAVLGGHEVAGQHPKSVGRVHEIRERRQVPRCRAADGPSTCRAPSARHPVRGRRPPAGPAPARTRLPSASHHDVVDVGIDRDGLVGRQRPRRRRPDPSRYAPTVCASALGPSALAQRSSSDPEARRSSRRVLAALIDVVVHAQFVVRQRGLVVPAVRQHPVALVGQPLVPQLLEHPDHRLHEAEIQRLVVVVEVDPARLTGDVRAPFVGVLQHRGAAGVVELLDAHLFDLGLVGDAELALHLEFGGQSVRVPAEPALDLVAAHGAVPRHDVLDVSGEQMPVVRQPVGERRPVVEHVLRRTVAALDAGAEGVVVDPSSRGPRFPVPGNSVHRRRLRIGAHSCASPVPRFVQARGRRRAGCASAAVPPRLRTEGAPLDYGR